MDDSLQCDFRRFVETLTLDFVLPSTGAWTLISLEVLRNCFAGAGYTGDVPEDLLRCATRIVAGNVEGMDEAVDLHTILPAEGGRIAILRELLRVLILFDSLMACVKRLGDRLRVLDKKSYIRSSQKRCLIGFDIAKTRDLVSTAL